MEYLSYSGINPLNFSDPSGPKWFNIDNTWTFLDGVAELQVVSADAEGRSQVDQEGNVVYNTILGLDELLSIGGEFLTIHLSDGSSKSYPAISGEPENGRTNPDAQMDTMGPIPEGRYTVDPKDIQYWKNLDGFQKSFAKVVRGQWPGGTDSWGEIRVPILPKKDTRGNRTGNYFIHGGSEPGSRGCIDLCESNDSFFYLFAVPFASPMTLDVKYGGLDNE